MPKPTAPRDRGDVRIARRNMKRFFVIATEGTKDEPAYFEAVKQQFNRPHPPHSEIEIRIQEILPASDYKSAPTGLFDRLKAYDKQKGDELWLVCDVDDWGSNLPKALNQCEKEGFNWAVSNPCFEIWLLLHDENFKKRFTSSSECKKAGKQYLKEIGGYPQLLTQTSIAIQTAKARHSNIPASDKYPALEQTSQIFKIIEALYQHNL